LVEESLNRIRQIATADLTPDEAIDHALLEGKLAIQHYEHAKEDYRLKWPDTYVPTDAIYILTVRATGNLADNLLSRLNRTPEALQQGIANLSRKQANPPKLWTENAIEGAKGGISFLDSLPEHPKVQAEVKDQATLRAAIAKAQAISNFATFLNAIFTAKSGRLCCRRRTLQLAAQKNIFAS
jgi:hypothetical protein